MHIKSKFDGGKKLIDHIENYGKAGLPGLDWEYIKDFTGVQYIGRTLLGYLPPSKVFKEVAAKWTITGETHYFYVLL